MQFSQFGNGLNNLAGKQANQRWYDPCKLGVSLREVTGAVNVF